MRNATSRRPFFRNRLRYLFFVLVVAGVVFILATVVLELLEEIGLIVTERPDDRVAYGPAQLVHTRRVGGRKVRAIEDLFMLPSLYPAEKSPNTFRMFMTGGSFAMGSPYVMQGDHPKTDVGIPGWTRMELTLRYPSLNIEVINAAAGGQNSFRVRSIVEQLAGEKADLILVATGNNEGFVPPTRANEPLHRWILYRLLKKLIRPSAPPENRELYTAQTTDTETIAFHYKKNIDQIIQVCKRKKVPLALATLPINLKYPELGTMLREDDYLQRTKDAWCRRGEEAYAQGDFEQAASFFSRSENKEYGDWMAGICWEKLGRFETAKESYRKVANRIPFNRMRPGLNDFLRQVCAEQGVVLIDLEQALERRSPGGILQPDAFLDPCHMTWWGYRFAAMEVVDAIGRAGLIRVTETEPLPRPSLEEIIGQFGLQQILALPESQDRFGYQSRQ